MKSSLKLLALGLILTGATLLTTTIKADNPPPPPGHGTSGNVPGGGAPIGSGLAILLTLGAGYGAKKYYDSKKKKKLPEWKRWKVRNLKLEKMKRVNELKIYPFGYLYVGDNLLLEVFILRGLSTEQ